jgi:hypothetical protein
LQPVDGGPQKQATVEYRPELIDLAPAGLVPGDLLKKVGRTGHGTSRTLAGRPGLCWADITTPAPDL